MARKSDQQIKKLQDEINRLKLLLNVYQNTLVNDAMELDKKDENYKKLLNDAIAEIYKLIDEAKK